MNTPGAPERADTFQDPNFAVMSVLFGSVLAGDFAPNRLNTTEKHNLGLLAVAAFQKGSHNWSGRIPCRPDGLIDGMDFIYKPSWAPNMRTFTVIHGRTPGPDREGYPTTYISGILLRPDFGGLATLAIQENRVSPALSYLEILGNEGVVSQTPLTLENAPSLRDTVTQQAEAFFQERGHLSY